MKRLGSMVPTILMAALAFAIPIAAFAAGKTHTMKVEIVSVDANERTITFKDEKGGTRTEPLTGAAVAESRTVKPGNKVTVTCQDTEQGEHQAIKLIVKKH